MEQTTPLRPHPASDPTSDSEAAVYTATFTFAPGAYDDEFHRLDALVEQAARDNPGFLEKERWVSPDGEKRSVVYYWRSMEALKAFAKHPDHIEAKRRYREWYDGYEVTIARVLSRRGDGGLD